MSTILVIDDDFAIRKLLGAMLRSEGFEVITENNARSALWRLEYERIDLVITDIIMPDKDGFEFLLEMQEIRPELKAIAISGGMTCFHSEECLTTAKALGAVTVLSKPIQKQKLLQTVRDVFDAELVAE